MKNKAIRLKILVANNQLGKALSHVLDDTTIYTYPKTFNELVLMTMMYHRIKDREMKSVITHKEGDVMLNNLAINFLSFLDKSYLNIYTIDSNADN